MKSLMQGIIQAKWFLYYQKQKYLFIIFLFYIYFQFPINQYNLLRFIIYLRFVSNIKKDKLVIFKKTKISKDKLYTRYSFDSFKLRSFRFNNFMESRFKCRLCIIKCIKIIRLELINFIF